MKILILGGAGAMAGVEVRDLLDSERVEKVCLADFNLERVNDRSKKLQDDRVEALQADVRDVQGLKNTMKGWDSVINSTWYEYNMAVMGAAIDSGVHYLDLGGLYHTTLKQLTLDGKAKDAGVACVLGLGSSPGVTNLMAALGAAKLSRIREVRIRSGGASPGQRSSSLSPPYSFRTILDEASMPAAVLRKGRIEMVPASTVKEEFVLPDPVGKVEGHYTLHSELATLPQNLEKGVQEMNFIVAFSPAFAQAVSALVRLGLARKEEARVGGQTIVPYEVLTKLLDATTPPADESASFGVRRVELFGETDGAAAHLTYDCISGPHQKWGIGGRALGTGVPASLGAQWLAGGLITKRGVFPPELCINAERFLHELGVEKRGVVTFEDDGSSRRRL